jgi:hypothetical protein
MWECVVRVAGRRLAHQAGPRFVGANKVRRGGMNGFGAGEVDPGKLLAAQICAAQPSCAEFIWFSRS